MTNFSENKHSKRSIITVFLPAVITLVFLITIIFGVVLPAFEKSFLDGKKSTIKQLTSVVVDIANYYSELVKKEQLDLKRAQKKALHEIESLRYGDTKQDYFWICDFQPVMVMHPYSKEMVGKNLREYEDSAGTLIFLEFITMVSDQDSGFLNHTWHSKYDDQTVSPKLTYVTKFEPWNWVIGTGVYLDDVKRKTDQIYGHLSKLAIAVVVIIGCILFYLARQNVIQEKKRLSAEAKLARSREKYKTLVESAAEPMMMFFDNQCIYSNSSMQRLLGAKSEALLSKSIRSLLPDLPSSLPPYLSEEYEESKPIETLLARADGKKVQVRLHFTEKELGDETVVLMTARDLSNRRKIEEELGVSRQRYQWLTNQLQIGVFRTRPDTNFTFQEANPMALKLLGVKEEELGATGLSDIIDTSFDLRALEVQIRKKSVVKDTLIPISADNSMVKMVSVSMVITHDGEGTPLYYDGVVEDSSLQKEREEERADLLSTMQSSLMFLNEPIGKVAPPMKSYPDTLSVQDAVQTMIDSNNPTLLLGDDSSKVTGKFGNRELQKIVVSHGEFSTLPVREYMSTDLICVDENGPVFDAVRKLDDLETDHLCLTDTQGEITGLINDNELLQLHNYSATFLLKEIEESSSLQDLIECHRKLPSIVNALSNSGVDAKNITRTMSSVSDAAFNKVLDFSLSEVGEPPVPFAIIGLGSDGRCEQTLATDQDNALIFSDVPEEQLQSVRDYFLKLASKICHSLDKVGYELCKGEVMAMNPRWCQPVSVWKEYFSHWIASSTPQDLMELNIFFDYRCLYGEISFIQEIRSHLQLLLKNRPVFYHLMAENNLLFKVPLDFFGNISTETEGYHINCFNIKHVLAMVVGFARVHGIKHFLKTSNTLERLEIIYKRGAITKDVYDELVYSYDYLMRMRIRNQVQKIDNGEKPDNWINFTNLTQIEKDTLKKIFAKVTILRKKLTGKGDSAVFF